MDDRDRLEIERLLNLVQGFGWQEVRREETETQVVITIARLKHEVAVHGSPS